MFSKIATISAAAVAALFLVSPVLAADTNCTRTYTVVEGDICDGISRAHNVSTYQLAAVNSETIDAVCGNLQPGSTICLGTPGEDCTQVHVVENNDSCGSIGATYGLNSTILMLNNPQIESDCSNIYTGEVLCVAQTVIAPPIPQGFFNGNDQDTIEWVPVPDDGSDENEDLPYCDEVMP
jgi:LysM repeat protein